MTQRTVRAKTANTSSTIRSRSRVSTSPVGETISNRKNVEMKLTQLLQDVAQANATKNKGTREETAAKKALNRAMVDEGERAFTAFVTVDGDSVKYTASISAGTEEYIDPAEVLKLVGGNVTRFLDLVSVTKTKLEEVLGENAVIKCTKTRQKAEALKVEKVK